MLKDCFPDALHHIFLWKMWCKNAFDAKMHFCIICIFARKNVCKNALFGVICAALFLTFCWCWTFSFGKCSASHFVGAKMLCFLLCKKQRCVHFVLLNIFLWKMWCWTFYFVKCTRCWTFSFGKCNCAKIHFGIKCIWCKNAFLQCKCIFASNAFLHSWTFSFGKCDAKCILQSKMLQHQMFLCKMHQMHFCKPKC